MSARPLLLGHRGARREAPENTLEAFELCLKHRCDGFEFDVRLSADAHAVICHDPNIGRQDVARTAFKDLGAPSLEDVLAGFMSRAFLDIELKVQGVERTTIDLLRRHPPRKGYCVSSFLPQVVETLHRGDSTLPLGLICKSRTQLAGWTGSPVQTLFLERALCTAAVVDALHGAGKQIFVWTVNRENEMRIFADLGVDGIISDDTVLLVRTLTSSHEAAGSGPYQES